MRTIRACLILIFTALLSGQAFAGTSGTITKTFVYHLYWSGIRAGTSVLQYSSSPEGTTIKNHATSTRFISIFYRVNDRAESNLYPDGYPKRFYVKIHEGRTKKERVTDFYRDPDDSSQKIVFRDIIKGEDAEFFPENPAYDPLSGFYEMTKRALEVGRSYYIDIFDNKKLVRTEVEVLRRERISVPAGEFETLVVIPRLKTEGLFIRKGAMHIWVTDDDRKIPVLFKSKVTIGSFTAKLMEIY